MDAPATPTPAPPAWTRGGMIYAAVIFTVAAAAVGIAVARAGGPLPQGQWLTAAFFFGYGLFTISVGYRGPNRHYYSFDRISQVASILVLGPVDAAWINGLASLVYPLHRLRVGAPPRSVLGAALANSGIMSLMVLGAGSVYTAIGGAAPLLQLHGADIWSVLLLVVLMQVVNDVGMLGLTLASGRAIRGAFSPFSHALELCSAAAAVVVALVYNRLDPAAFILLLFVLGIGMLALRQFAVMRNRLEGIVEERTQSLRQQSLELERQATHDNLTGLFNRRYADRWLVQQLEHLHRHHPQPLTVALADIDNFKQINDRHSHATGDEVLRRVAALLRQNCRAGDMVARYGGEEFLFCFPRTELREALVLCESLRSAVAAGNWAELGLPHGVTISFGVAARRGDSTLDSLLRQADGRLYAAKDDGRNRVVA